MITKRKDAINSIAHQIFYDEQTRNEYKDIDSDATIEDIIQYIYDNIEIFEIHINAEIHFIESYYGSVVS